MRNWKNVGLMAVIAIVAFSGTAMAEEAAAAASGGSVKTWLALAAGFGMAIASFGGALGQSKAISAAVEGIARNPGAAGKIFAPTLILGLALIESLVLFTFVIAFMLQGKI